MAEHPPSPLYALPPGERIYAIGDAHGHLDALCALHDKIRAHALQAPPAKITVLYIGDLIDRGPDSAGVIDLLMRPPSVPNAHSVVLMGNHERMMLDALTGDLTAAHRWVANGGEEALQSWNVPGSAPPSRWREWIPPAVVDFLRSRPLMHRAGGYFFAHAGIRPGIPLDRQSPHDLLWIREPFLSWPRPLPARVVHGHTPTPRPEVLAHRINIDTGAGWGGILTCAVMEGDDIAFLETPA